MLKILTFYKFFKINNIFEYKNIIKIFCKKKKILGTVIISKEGINTTISGTSISIMEFQIFIQKIFNTKFHFKISKHEKHAFLRLKVKLKEEIVKIGIGNLKIINSKSHVTPEKWNNIIKDENTLIIDVRNKYETEIGNFENAVPSMLSNFSEFPNWVDNNKSKMNDKKLAIYCTGGIRCEKAKVVLHSKGFKDVFQLSGGIINYLDKVEKKKSLWQGECFVFDERVSLNHSLKKGNFEQCYACRMPISEHEMSSEQYKKGISCPKCFKELTTQKKRNLEEREKQIKLAFSKGLNHIGSKP